VKLSIVILVVFFSMMASPVFTQDIGAKEPVPDSKRYINLKSYGALAFVGVPLYLLPEGFNYVPLLLGGYFHFPLIMTRKRINLAINIIPLVGVVPSTPGTDYEMGVDAFLELSIAISKKSIISVNIGSGPYFISVETEKQANGYIFSNYLLLAYKRRLALNREKTWEINFYGGVRHISNARLKDPNFGIDSVIFGIGFGRLFERKRKHKRQ